MQTLLEMFSETELMQMNIGIIAPNVLKYKAWLLFYACIVHFEKFSQK